MRNLRALLLISLWPPCLAFMAGEVWRLYWR